MISNAGRIVSAVVCAGSRDHAVGRAGMDHQRAEVAHVGDGVERQLRGHPLVARAARDTSAAYSARSGESERIDDPRPRRASARAPPRARGRRRATPRIVRSTTSRRNRMSAARRTRSSSPSGSTMCRRRALARSSRSYSNIIGVLARRGRQRDALRQLAWVDPGFEDADARWRSSPRPSAVMIGLIACTAAAVG